MGPSFLQGFIPSFICSMKQISEEASLISWNPELWACCTPSSCPKILNLCYFTVTSAKAAVELHVPHQLLLVGEKKDQQSTSPHWLLYYLESISVLERKTWRKKSHKFTNEHWVIFFFFKSIAISVMLLHFLFTYVYFFILNFLYHFIL